MIWNYLIVYLLLGVISSIGSVAYLGKLNTGEKMGKLILWAFAEIAAWPFWAAFFIVGAIRKVRYSCRCPWCNEAVNYTDPEAVQKHVESCQKHPMLNEIARLNKKIEMYRFIYWTPKEKKNEPTS